MSTRTTGLLVLTVLVAALAYLAAPWRADGRPALALGLDLEGGLRVVLQADQAEPLPEDLDAARRVIESRVDEFGVAEPLVQTAGDGRILVG